MSPRTLILCAALTFICLTGTFGPATAQAQMPGGYSSISVTDPEVVRAAQFAVQDKNARFFKILSAESQVVAGRNFRLRLDVTSGNEVRQAQAIVYFGFNGTREVTSWTWMGNPRPAMSPSDRGGLEASQFVVTNRLACPVEMFWLNAGQEVYYTTLQAGETKSQDTFVGHEWIFRESRSKTVVMDFKSTGGRATLALEPIAQPTATAQLVVTNNSTHVVAMYYVDHGTEVSYGVIKPGQTVFQGTFAGHEWIFRDAQCNTFLRDVTSMGGRAQVVIG